MDYFQLDIAPCLSHDVELLTNLLESQGAISISLIDGADSPILEPDLGTTPLWPTSVIQALFDNQTLVEWSKNSLEQDFPNLTYKINLIPDKNWVQESFSYFIPQRFGQRLIVCPSWHATPDPNAVTLILDPGLAFGTGSHPTTALCLSWLDQAFLQGNIVLDYGCGSGILALAALKLGAQKAIAIDIDPRALEATKQNAIKNNINSQQLQCSLPQPSSQTVDIIIANILLSPLLSLQEDFEHYLQPNGLLALSGILDHQTPTLMEQYTGHFNLIEEKKLDGWSLIVLKKGNK